MDRELYARYLRLRARAAAWRAAHPQDVAELTPAYLAWLAREERALAACWPGRT